MKKVLLVLFLAIASCTIAQETFEKNFGVLAYTKGMVLQPDSSIIIVAGDSSNDHHFYIIKIDKDGVFRWMKTDSSSRADNYFTHSIFLPCYDGNFIVAGYRSDTIINEATSIIKFDTSGNVVWNKTYSRPSHITSIHQTSDSGYIFAGHLPDTMESTLHYADYIVRIDSIGNILWTKVFQNYNSAEVIQTDEGGFLLEARNEVSKLDGNGDILSAFQITNRNNFWGVNRRKSLKVNSNTYIFADNSFLSCYDSTGNLKWDRVISNNWGFDNRRIVDIARLNDSTIILLGNLLMIWPSAYIQKIDLSGNLIQQIVYVINHKVTPYSLLPYSDGRILIACTFDPYQIRSNALFLIKTDSSGSTGCGETPATNQDSLRIDTVIPVTRNYISGNNSFITDSLVSYTSYTMYEDTLCYQTITMISPSATSPQFQIFPNPVTNQFTITSAFAIKEITIYNVLGEKRLTLTLTLSKGEGMASIDVSGFTQGIYFVRVDDGEKWVVRKLVVE